ncbi:unnamed protein product [Dicrocoelium dendriticum]|nr:unnamed protein product [Dicrocoelium dendriticum]
MRYCATDVLMTFDVFEKLMPLFEQRFPHPATLHGLLEMGSMYLPINDSWTKFQQRADAGFASNELRQKRLLMQLANEALQRYSSPDKDPSNDPWLWDLDWSKPKASPKTEVEKKLATLPKLVYYLINRAHIVVVVVISIGPGLAFCDWRKMKSTFLIRISYTLYRWIRIVRSSVVSSNAPVF